MEKSLTELKFKLIEIIMVMPNQISKLLLALLTVTIDTVIIKMKDEGFDANNKIIKEI